MSSVKISSKNRIAVATIVFLASSAIFLFSVMSTDTEQTSLTRNELELVRGLLPNQRALYGDAVCSGTSVVTAFSERPEYDCGGSLGPCVVCIGNSTLSGFASTFYSNPVQPSGGANVTCTSMAKWTGLCVRGATDYYCDTTV